MRRKVSWSVRQNAKTHSTFAKKEDANKWARQKSLQEPGIWWSVFNNETRTTECRYKDGLMQLPLNFP